MYSSARALVLSAIAVLLFVGHDAYGQAIRTMAAAFTGGTLTSGIVFSGVTDDISVTTGEDLTLRGGGTSGSAGSIVLQSRSGSSSILDSAGNTEGTILTSSGQASLIIRQANASSTGTLKVNATYAQVGSGGNIAAGAKAACFNESTTAGGGTDIFCANGDGAVQHLLQVTALPATLCDAAGEVGSMYIYSRAASNTITFCACEQTAAATFAFGAITAAGNCAP